jgi:hypothetical protein
MFHITLKLPIFMHLGAAVRQWLQKDALAGTGRYSVLLLSPTTGLRFYRTESLHPPRHPVTAAVLRSAINDTPSNWHFISCVPYFPCANLYSSSFAMPSWSASELSPLVLLLFYCSFVTSGLCLNFKLFLRILAIPFKFAFLRCCNELVLVSQKSVTLKLNVLFSYLGSLLGWNNPFYVFNMCSTCTLLSL